MDIETYETLAPKAAEEAKNAVRAGKVAASIKDGHTRYKRAFEHLAK